MGNIVYYVTARGVYDQGVYFASLNKGSAEEFMKTWVPDYDHYHSWSLEEIELDETPQVSPKPDHTWPTGVRPHPKDKEPQET